MLSTFLDAAFSPTAEQAAIAKKLGYVACGFYLPNTPRGAQLNTWTVPQKQTLDAAGLHAIPIIVPPFDLATDPALTARIAYTTAVAYGLTPTQSVLYSGNHIEQTGGVTGGLWLPIPGAAPQSIGPLSAIQYSTTNISGWDVDISAAAADFPFSCIVVDFEHATAPDGGWYAAFQSTIAQISAYTPPTPPAHSKEPEVIIIRDPEGAASTFDGNVKRGISSAADMAAMAAAGVPVVNVSDVYYASVPNAQG